MLLSEVLHGHEFRDPSTYASFYYPPEGPSTEREQSDAEREAEENVKEDAAIYQEEYAKLYKGVTVKGEIGEVEDEEIDSGKDYYHYTCYVKCILRISIPRENFAGKDDDEIISELPSDYCITSQTEVEYDNLDEEEVTDTSIEVVISGNYRYYFENDKYY